MAGTQSIARNRALRHFSIPQSPAYARSRRLSIASEESDFPPPDYDEDGCYGSYIGEASPPPRYYEAELVEMEEDQLRVEGGTPSSCPSPPSYSSPADLNCFYEDDPRVRLHSSFVRVESSRQSKLCGEIAPGLSPP
eukprot:Polyplicarium_translucidae@DN4191_c0_g1_i1.p2